MATISDIQKILEKAKSGQYISMKCNNISADFDASVVQISQNGIKGVKTENWEEGWPVDEGWSFDISKTQHLTSLTSDADSWEINEIASLKFTKNPDNPKLIFARSSGTGSSYGYYLYTWDFSGSAASGRKYVKNYMSQTNYMQHVCNFLNNGNQVLSYNYGNNETTAYLCLLSCTTPYDITSCVTPGTQITFSGINKIYSIQDMFLNKDEDMLILFCSSKIDVNYYTGVHRFAFDKTNNTATFIDKVDFSDMPGPSVSGQHVALSPDGKRLVMGTYDSSSNIVFYSYTMSSPYDFSAMTYDNLSCNTGIQYAYSYKNGFTIDQSGTKLLFFRLNNAYSSTQYLDIFNLQK